MKRYNVKGDGGVNSGQTFVTPFSPDLIFLNGILQTPEQDYTADGNRINFDVKLFNTDTISFLQFPPRQLR